MKQIVDMQGNKLKIRDVVMFATPKSKIRGRRASIYKILPNDEGHPLLLMDNGLTWLAKNVVKYEGNEKMFGDPSPPLSRTAKARLESFERAARDFEIKGSFFPDDIASIIQKYERSKIHLQTYISELETKVRDL